MGRGFRLSLMLGAAAMCIGGTISAEAAEYTFGETNVITATTVSVGVGIRTHKQDCAKISTLNGGCLIPGYTTKPNINTDDGDINVGQWDVFSARAKFVSEAEAQYRDYGAFVRVKGFYDYAGDKLIGEERTDFGKRPLKDSLRGNGAHNAAAWDISLLDAFVYGNFDVLNGSTLNARLGRQVVNWGESLVIQGGINQFQPVDVSALRTPGAEIKEALVPQEMIYASLDLPASSSIAAWYGLHWRKTEFDPVGTFFSVPDFVGPGGNYLNFFGDGVQPLATSIRIADPEEGKNSGEFGVRLGHNAEWLNGGTELALYFVNYHSKLPIVEFSNGLLDILPGKPYPDWRYRQAFPEDIKLYGASFATTIDELLNGTAIAGEIVFQPDLPFQLSAGESMLARAADKLYAFYGIPMVASTLPYDHTIGAFPEGFTRTDAISGQLATVSTLSTSDTVTSALGADLIMLVANWGFQYLPNVSSTQLNAMSVTRSENQMPSRAPFPLPGLIDPNFPVLHPDTFSHGYRLIANVQYNNVFDTPWTLTPGIQFGQDFHTSAGPIGPGFLDNRKTLSLGVRGSYQNTWNAGIQWTATRGNELQNSFTDRDFMTIDVSYAF